MSFYLSVPQLAALLAHGADCGLRCSAQEVVSGAQHQVRCVRGPRHKVREAVPLLGALPLLLRTHVRGAQNIRLTWVLPGSLCLALEDNHVFLVPCIAAHTTGCHDILPELSWLAVGVFLIAPGCFTCDHGQNIRLGDAARKPVLCIFETAMHAGWIEDEV